MAKRPLSEIEDEIAHFGWTEEFEGMSRIALEYGLFTVFEFNAASKFFQSDFADLFWAIENLRGKQLKRQLRGYKIEYDHRFYSEHKREEQRSYFHHHSKLITYIEDLIAAPPKGIPDRTYNFEEIFKDLEEAQLVLHELVSNKFIDELTHIWKLRKKGEKAILVTLFRVLSDRGYLKEGVNDDIFSKISRDFFQYSVSTKTFYTYIREKKYNTDFNFLPRSKYFNSDTSKRK